MQTSDGGRETFTVRIWREPREQAGTMPACRGMVEHLRSGERRFFHRLEDMTGFVRQHGRFDDQPESA